MKLNRYAQVTFHHRDKQVHINRWGRFYISYYAPLTKSSLKRLKRVLESLEHTSSSQPGEVVRTYEALANYKVVYELHMWTGKKWMVIEEFDNWNEACVYAKESMVSLFGPFIRQEGGAFFKPGENLTGNMFIKRAEREL